MFCGIDTRLHNMNMRILCWGLARGHTFFPPAHAPRNLYACDQAGWWHTSTFELVSFIVFLNVLAMAVAWYVFKHECSAGTRCTRPAQNLVYTVNRNVSFRTRLYTRLACSCERNAANGLELFWTNELSGRWYFASELQNVNKPCFHS